MNIEYYYIRKRANFGRPYNFFNDGPTILDNVLPDKRLDAKYVLRNPVNKGVQKMTIFSEHEANTWRKDYTDHGMYHDQGGWPKEVNIQDEEVVLRYKKKIEREDSYVKAMKELTKPIEHAVLQNNAINIYQNYFDNTIKLFSVKDSLSQIRSIFRDIGPILRPVSHLSWSPDGESSFVTSYCNTKFQRMEPAESTEACIWNVELPKYPQTVFDSQIPIVCMEWNPWDRNILIGGLYNGQIAAYDVRKPPRHVEITTDVVSHRELVHSVIWISTKTGNDFFSTSADGVVKWWDYRNLNSVLDSIILDFSKNQTSSQAYASSCLEYDPSIPAKYLVGTENGYVICGNRKGTTFSEKIPWILKTHSGPLYAVERNFSVSKIFLTVGDWRVKIWSEDCKESPIMWTNQYTTYLTDGGWSKTRYSAFFVTRADGYLDIWDILVEQKNPLLSVKVSNKALTRICMEDNGRLAVVGDEDGKVYLIQYGESLSSCMKNDKVILSAMFEREGRREKILEGRMREVKLAAKLKTMAEEQNLSKTTIPDAHDEILEKAEENYWEQVNKSALAENEKRMEELVALYVKPEIDEGEKDIVSEAEK